MPRVIYTKSDGEIFGEMSVQESLNSINASIEDQNGSPKNNEQRKPNQTAKRSASCITTELTDMLVLDANFSYELLQPVFGTSKGSNEMTQPKKDENQSKGSDSARSQNTSSINAEINQRTKILQQITHFKDVDPRFLTRIAASIEKRTFHFGEYLVKRGEVPKGMFLIIKGQCKVIAQRFGHRKLAEKTVGAGGA